MQFIAIVRYFKAELLVISTVFVVLIVLPIASVVVLAGSAYDLAQGALVSVNPVTKIVSIFDPDGNKVTDLELSVTWPTNGYVSDEFGTFQPFRGAWGLGRHSGIDIASPTGQVGQPVTAFASGTLIKVKSVDDNACGKYVVLDHGYSVTSWYCHLDSVADIPLGSTVEPGQVIGYMGNTGASTGPHLHFMIKVYDIPVNPRNFVSGDPVRS